MNTQDSIKWTFSGGWIVAGVGFLMIGYAYYQQGKLSPPKK